MDMTIESNIRAHLAELRSKRHVLSFSTGADAIASWLRMREFGIDPELVYFEYVPGIPMIENYLTYFEKIAHKKIHRIHSQLGLDDLLNGCFQHPMIGSRLYKSCKKDHYKVPGSAELNEFVMSAFPDHLLAIGIRCSDGIFRAMKLRKPNGFIDRNKNEWYPVASFDRSDIKAIIAESGIKLPVDYRLFGRSFESLRPRVADKIKQHCPQSWQHLLQYFPTANLIAAQGDLLGMNRDIQSRITSYAHLAFTSEDCTK